ncbi:MAG: hypothetical protein M3P08_09425 [Thermoproteota archaeon]|nr:hypothetical protein [Thermoproteota archaeon]
MKAITIVSCVITVIIKPSAVCGLIKTKFTPALEAEVNRCNSLSKGDGQH